MRGVKSTCTTVDRSAFDREKGEGSSLKVFSSPRLSTVLRSFKFQSVQRQGVLLGWEHLSQGLLSPAEFTRSGGFRGREGEQGTHTLPVCQEAQWPGHTIARVHNLPVLSFHPGWFCRCTAAPLCSVSQKHSLSVPLRQNAWPKMLTPL